MSDEKGFKPTKTDIAHTLTKAGLSSIPLVGGAAAELMNLIWEPALSKRRDEWLKGLAENLQNLEEKVEGFKIENLADNESFITISIQASQAAIRNHQREKLDILRNAVLNSALKISLTDDLNLYFLSLIENLTVIHIKVLNLIPTDGMQINIKETDKSEINRKLAEELNLIIFEGKNQKYIFQQSKDLLAVVINDLDTQGLTSIIPCTKRNEFESDVTWYDLKLTNLGRMFLKFITTPNY
jgi:hypothetical protein